MIRLRAIIVTHNSEPVLSRCLEHLTCQTLPCSSIHIVDSGSDSTEYLDQLEDTYAVQVVKKGNIGFSSANNIGAAILPRDTNVLVFLNPDTFLPEDYLQQAVQRLEQSPESAVVSGTLEKYDIRDGKALGIYDSSGIFRTWYGRWYDRDQGMPISTVSRKSSFLPAACGALLVCRFSTLQPFLPEIFPEEFFLYKEDIELCLRLRKNGWKILYDPSLLAYHGRGWQKSRGKMPYSLRLLAAQSEILLYKRHPSPYMLWAILKYLLVRYLKV